MFDISNVNMIMVCQYRDGILTLNDWFVFIYIGWLCVNIGILCWYIIFHTSHVDCDNSIPI